MKCLDPVILGKYFPDHCVLSQNSPVGTDQESLLEVC